jgi:hypothetical protein
MQRPISWESPQIHPNWTCFQTAAQQTPPSELSIAAALQLLSSGKQNLVATRNTPLQPLSERTVDFSIRAAPAPQSGGEQRSPIVKKMIELIRAILNLPSRLLRWIANRCRDVAMKIIFRLSGWPKHTAAALQADRAELANRSFWLLREVVVEGAQCRTTGLVISSADTMLNRKWVLQATGSDQSIENYTRYFGRLWLNRGYNTLLLQGPGAPLTEGASSPFNLGEAQRLGIRFLETVLQAREIVLSGLSLGGGTIGEAILQHNFLTGENAPQYRVIRTITFSSLKDVIAETVNGPVAALSRVLGCEMRNFESSKRLSELRIPETIVGCGDGQRWLPDDVIGAGASLGRQVSAANLTLKTFVRVPWKHVDARYPRLAADQLVAIGPQPPQVVVIHSPDQNPPPVQELARILEPT